MHLHVGSNTPGYLPDSVPECFGDLASALDALRTELRFLQSDFYERCNGDCPDGSGEACAWCEAAGAVEAALSAIADGDAARHLDQEPELGWTFRPPEGPDIHHWCARPGTTADACAPAGALTT
ncbi:hypothetical protein RM780_09815 [Streptomyces sp. DSM 44917]|uniref:Uncharacterized protein n=1 Tax=Streptomyces boetiae TaxID=3075541 RepID=A0ABU2L7I1_9ACTN|nr:hypothetical protein [Streptomyces sp. DSM 44917]MDT0307258.1 hypothetical protein [Streptomyces sp. DSM 44917]